MNEQKRARFRGCLLGLATGDAVGTAVELSPPGSFEPVTDMLGSGPFDLEPGQWTDDTSMALCLAESLIECGRFDPVDQLNRYVRWMDEGHLSSTGKLFDIGISTQAALYRFKQSHEPWCGSTDGDRAGNGSIMRLAAVPMYFAGKPAEAIERAADSSRTTHGAVTCVDACRLLAGLIVGALNGEPKDRLLADHYAPVPGYWDDHPLCAEIDAIAAGSYLRMEPPEIRGSGYVVRSLEAALWAFAKSNDFRDGCLLAVNLGEDADTTASVYGQIAGAFYGREGIPAEWLSKLAMADQITNFADRLLEHSRS